MLVSKFGLGFKRAELFSELPQKNVLDIAKGVIKFSNVLYYVVFYCPGQGKYS